MTGIGEKIKEKLHLGHDSGHEKTSTAAHETTKTTTAPDVGYATAGDTGNTAGMSPTSTGTTGHTYSQTAATSPVGGTKSGPAISTYPTGPGTDQSASKTSSQVGTQAQGERKGMVCGSKTYTTTEDRPVEKEVIERVIEHHPVEKKFVVETRPAGEHELKDQRREESVGVREEIKRVAPKSSPCEGGPELVLQK